MEPQSGQAGRPGAFSAQLGGEVVQLVALQQGGDEEVEVGRASSSPALLLFNEGVIGRIAKLMKVEKNNNIRLSLIRVFGDLAKTEMERALAVIMANIRRDTI